jgi:hypothetical protein
MRLEHTETTKNRAEARGSFAPVLALQAGLFVAAPFLTYTRVGPTVLNAFSCLMLALAVRAASGRTALTRRYAIAALVFAILREVVSRTGATGLSGPATVLFVALIATACFVVLRAVLRARRADGDEILAAVCSYLLLGMMWATAYAFFDWLDLDPPAFSRDLVSRGIPGSFERETFGALLYFSYITLTTVGYGDIVPTHSITRNLAAFEALTGQIYIAVLLARLVALHTMKSNEE